MATDFEKNAFKPNLGLGGAAMRKMQQLAQSLYESTPGLQEEIPRNTSKILANVKREDNRAEVRAKTFLQDSSATNLRKGGTIEKKDLSMQTWFNLTYFLAIAMSAEDWETKYFEILDKFNHEKHLTVKLKENMIKKQERYIDREHEYRKTINQIEQSIQEKSTKPLEIIHEHDENQLLLNGVDPSDQKQQDLMEKERKQKLKNDLQINPKNVKAIHNVYDKIQETIGMIQENTAKELWKQRSEIMQTLDKKLEDIKQQLRAETEKKRENQYDFKEKEKELNEHLETMTQIAQKIDDENRNLMKKNSDLKIQYMSQENDRDLLLKQIIYQKKEHQRLRRMVDEKKKQAEEVQKTQDNTLNMNNQTNVNNTGSIGGGQYQNENSRHQNQMGQNTMPDIKNQRVQSGLYGKNQGRISQNNISGLNNSRRNISLTGANMFAGNSRPKTAAMPGLTGIPRPPTAAYGLGNRMGTNMTAGGPYGLNFTGGQRAISAGFMHNPRIKRYEDIIQRLKKMLTMEKKSLRMVRTLCSKEIESKNQLEKILRQCVDDVKNEIAKKRSENKSIYHKGRRDGNLDEKALTQQEREKIIEVLLSQERVLTLLYDKTFPPRPATAKVGLKNAFSGSGLSGGGVSNQNLRQFNYYGQINEDEIGEEDAQEVEKLEKEIEDVLKNRISTADGLNRGRPHPGQDGNNIINISKGDSFQQRTQNGVNGGKRNLMSAAYRQNRQGYNDETHEIGDDIYEDEESSDGME